MSLLFIASMQDRKDVGLAFETVSKVGVSASRAGSVLDLSAGQKGNQIPSITFGGTWHTCCPRDCQRGAPPPPAIPLLAHMHHAHIEAEHLFFWGRARTGITLHGRSIAKETNKVFPTWDRFWASTRVLWKRSWAWSTLTHGNNLHKPCPDFQQKYELCWELSSDITL